AGKVAVVTGGASGVGAATARLLVEEGAQVVICARHAPAHPVWRQEQAARCVVFQRCDVAVQTDIEAVIATAFDSFGGIEVLINNAGKGCLGYTPDPDPEDWRQTIAVNLDAVFFRVQDRHPSYEE